MANVKIPKLFRRQMKAADGKRYLSDAYWFRKMIDGRDRWVNTGCTRKADAQEFLVNWLQRACATGETPEKVKPLSFERMKELIIADYKNNGLRSLRRCKEGLAHLDTIFKDYSAAAITTNEVERYKAYRLDQGHATSTINRELGYLMRMFKIATQLGMTKLQPFIKKFTENNTRKEFFEHKEFQELMRHLPDYLLPLVHYAYLTGCRFGELVSLNWKDVDFERKMIRIPDNISKNKEARSIPMFWEQMFEDLKGVAIAYGTFEPNKPVFLGRRQGRITNIQKSWANALKAAGLENKIFHDFRRTAIRNMVRSGIPEVIAMAISGHKSRTVFDRYNIVSERDIINFSGKVESYLQTMEAPNL